MNRTTYNDMNQEDNQENIYPKFEMNDFDKPKLDGPPINPPTYSETKEKFETQVQVKSVEIEKTDDVPEQNQDSLNGFAVNGVPIEVFDDEGIFTVTLDRGDHDRFGFSYDQNRVEDTRADSAASKKLFEGDEILFVDGVDVRTVDNLRELLGNNKATLVVRRRANKTDAAIQREKNQSGKIYCGKKIAIELEKINQYLESQENFKTQVQAKPEKIKNTDAIQNEGTQSGKMHCGKKVAINFPGHRQRGVRGKTFSAGCCFECFAFESDCESCCAISFVAVIITLVLVFGPIIYFLNK